MCVFVYLFLSVSTSYKAYYCGGFTFSIVTVSHFLFLGPFYGAIAVLSVTRCRCCCRCRRCRGHRCAGGVRQWQRATVATPGEWQCKTARSGEWAQHFSNASCFVIIVEF